MNLHIHKLLHHTFVPSMQTRPKSEKPPERIIPRQHPRIQAKLHHPSLTTPRLDGAGHILVNEAMHRRAAHKKH